MVKKRENYKIIILEPALSKIKNNICPVCNKPKKDFKRKNARCCSPKCTMIFNKKYYILGWGNLRDRIFKRDNYTCVKCGKQPKIKSSNDRKEPAERFFSYFKPNYGWNQNKILEKCVKKGKEFVLYANDSKLIADHIIPIALGGEEWNMKNIQTLCIECDKKKTKKDADKIAKLRNIEKKQKNNKQLESFI